MNLKLIPIQLTLKEKFVISRDAYSEKKAIIVELSDGTYSGYGEACEHVYYKVTQSNMIQALENIRDFIENYDFQTPEKFWDDSYPFLKNEPFAHCALDQAAHDLFGKQKQKPCYKLWDLKLENLPISNYTISIGTVDEMVAKMKAYPFPIYKIKLGTPDDIAIVKAIRKQTDAILRIDANCAWTVQETIDNSKALKELGVELIEQPMAADDWAGMREVYHHASLPLIADESCVNLESVSKCHNHFHGINIKLMKCGGITPAHRMIKQAKELGLSVMMGCMTEGSIGISAIAHMLPLLDYVDMDAALLLADDPAFGARVQQDGTVIFSKENGLGTSLL